MIYKLEDNTYVISAYNVWRPGIFKSRKAAYYARLFTDERINELKIRGVITFNMLKDIYYKRKSFK